MACNISWYIPFARDLTITSNFVPGNYTAVIVPVGLDVLIKRSYATDFFHM